MVTLIWDDKVHILREELSTHVPKLSKMGTVALGEQGLIIFNGGEYFLTLNALLILHN